MKETVKVIDLDKYEQGILIRALNDFRNNLIKQGIITIPVDELLLKVLDAPEKKRYFSKSTKAYER